MTTTAQQTTASKFNDLADRLDRDAADKYRPRLSNTPKRDKEAKWARIEGDNLKRAANAFRALAVAIANGTLPPILADIKSKKEMLELTRNQVDCSGGYYSVADTGELANKTLKAIALRDFAEAKIDQAERAERERQNRIADLESRIRFSNIPGFFPTPTDLARRLVELAEVQPGHKTLEPSAGKGDIAEQLRSAGAEVATCEVVWSLCDILSAKGFEVVRGDFLEEFRAGEQFDRIVMNPPFERMQDIDHVRRAFDLLKPGGRLVSIMSAGPFFRADRKAVDFLKWLEQSHFRKFTIEGAFAKGFVQTGVACKIVTIDRRAA